MINGPPSQNLNESEKIGLIDTKIDFGLQDHESTDVIKFSEKQGSPNRMDKDSVASENQSLINT